MQTPSMVGKGHISGFAPFNVCRSCSQISTTIVDWLYWNKSENSWVSHCICIYKNELVFPLQLKQYSPFNQKLHNCIFSSVGKDAILIMWKISGRQLSSGAHRLPVQKLTISLQRENFAIVKIQTSRNVAWSLPSSLRGDVTIRNAKSRDKENYAAKLRWFLVCSY